MTFLQAFKRGLRLPFEAHARSRRRLLPEHSYLSVCAIFKNESRFLREWIIFHRGVGVEHFFLYNNNSSDDFRSVLAEFDCITLIDWPTTQMAQRSAYLDCIQRFGCRARWIAFIDIDEFMFSPANDGAVSSVLRQFEHCPAVLAVSPFFGANGIAKVPQAVIPAFTKRTRDNFSGKSIVDPRCVRDVQNAHVFRYFGSTPYMTAPIEALRINHYWARSLEEIDAKCNRGDVWGDLPPEQRQSWWVRDFEATLNEVDDRMILPIAENIFRRSPGNST